MMKKIIFTLFIFTGCISCKKIAPKEIAQVVAVKKINYNQLKPLLEKMDGKIYVINFWATWCAPCVEELPYFEKINQEFANKNVKVLLVSLDFPKQLDKKLVPFVKKNNLQSEIVLLDDVNQEIWMDAVDKNWSGAIPATLIYNSKKRKFYEKSFDYKLLEKELMSFLK